MTNKEWIKVLQNLQDWLYFSSMNGGTSLQREAIDKAIEALSQPELIHCGECKHYVFIDDRKDCFPIRGCSLTGFNDVDAGDFCSHAERREVTE